MQTLPAQLTVKSGPGAAPQGDALALPETVQGKAPQGKIAAHDIAGMQIKRPPADQKEATAPSLPSFGDVFASERTKEKVIATQTMIPTGPVEAKPDVDAPEGTDITAKETGITAKSQYSDDTPPLAAAAKTASGPNAQAPDQAVSDASPKPSPRRVETYIDALQPSQEQSDTVPMRMAPDDPQVSVVHHKQVQSEINLSAPPGHITPPERQTPHTEKTEITAVSKDANRIDTNPSAEKTAAPSVAQPNKWGDVGTPTPSSTITRIDTNPSLGKNTAPRVAPQNRWGDVETPTLSNNTKRIDPHQSLEKNADPRVGPQMAKGDLAGTTDAPFSGAANRSSDTRLQMLQGLTTEPRSNGKLADQRATPASAPPQEARRALDPLHAIEPAAVAQDSTKTQSVTRAATDVRSEQQRTAEHTMIPAAPRSDARTLERQPALQPPNRADMPSLAQSQTVDTIETKRTPRPLMQAEGSDGAVPSDRSVPTKDMVRSEAKTMPLPIHIKPQLQSQSEPPVQPLASIEKTAAPSVSFVPPPPEPKGAEHLRTPQSAQNLTTQQATPAPPPPPMVPPRPPASAHTKASLLPKDSQLDLASLSKQVFSEAVPLGRVESTIGQATSPLSMSTRPDLPTHVARQFVDALQSSQQKPVDIALNPEELGRVRLALSASETGMILQVTADRPETLDLMRRHIAQLGQEFQDLGYGDISFSFAGGDAQHDETEGGNDTQGGLHDLTSETEDHTIAENTPHTQLSTGDTTGLDVRF